MMTGSLMYMVALVLLWWIANGIASIASKSMMVSQDSKNTTCTYMSLTAAFEDVRWLELTAIQHLFGAVASIVLLKALQGKTASIWPTASPKATIYTAGLANVVGNLATNAAYALVSSGATQVIKSYEPIFTFFLSLCLYKNYKDDLTVATLVSIVTMSAGACTFVVLDKSLNVWGLLAAICSNMGFATRNIFLKKLAWDSPIQKYVVISICSVILLLPIVLLKMVLVSTSTSLLTHAQESIVSAASHFTYNTASITVLQDITPLTHATLNLAKRVFVIIANLIYFRTPVSTTMLMGLLIFFTGLALYSTRNRRSVKEAASMVAFFVVMTGIWLHCQHIYFSIQTTGHEQRQQQIASVSSVDIKSELSYNQQILTTKMTKDLQTVPPKLDIPTVPLKVNLQASPVLFKKCKSYSYTISTAWTYDRPLSADLLKNIEHLHNMEPCTRINVYCGTSPCVREIMDIMDDPSITVEFLVISDLVKDTPLEKWFARHPLYKVLAGIDFEDHLQRAVQLGILLKYGGIYIDPRIRVTGENQILTNNSCVNGWASSKVEIDVMCFPKGHTFIQTLAEYFVHNYPRQVSKRLRFSFKFDNVLKRAFTDPKLDRPDIVVLDYKKLEENKTLLEHHHFGVLWFDREEKVNKWSNRGDELQSLAGLQFLPFVDNLVDRDRMSLLPPEEEPLTIFLNAWYDNHTKNWPPPGNLHPIMTSVRVQNNVQDKWAVSSDFLKQNQPIGCQDLNSLKFLRRLNIQSYFSGCLTLMFRSPSLSKEKETDGIYFVDVKWDIIRLFPQEIVENSTTLHFGTGYVFSGLRLFSEAYNLLEEYATAKVVITQRIQCAMSCVGMGIPVVFIDSPQMPGGRGSTTQSSPEMHELTPMFHTVNLYDMSMSEAVEVLENFPWDNPPPNPNPGMMMRMRATFWNVIRQNEALHDAAHKFGMIPLQPPPVLASEREQDEKLTFHLVFTESTFKWYHWRTVESIFHHHPFAKVTIHSNTLQQSEFHVLTDSGYSIEVEDYSLTDLLKDTPAEDFISKLSSAKSSPHWQSHETNLLRLLVLYKWGGVYMDNDMIVVNPLDKLPKNLLTWEDTNNHSISGSFLALERDSHYLRVCLAAYPQSYDDNDSSGLELLTGVWKQWVNKGEVVAMQSDLFYMFTESKVQTECFSINPFFDVDMKFVNKEAHAVRLSFNSEETDLKIPIAEGTICKHIFNSFCVLCDTQY